MSHGCTEAGWLLNADVHTYLTGAELVTAAKASGNVVGGSASYFPLDRSRVDQPEVLVHPSPAQRRVCPANHQPRSADWACRVCERFNFWDHNTCTGCNKERSLQQVDRGALKEAVQSFYSQVAPLDVGVSHAQALALQKVDAIPLTTPAQQLQQQQGLAAMRVPMQGMMVEEGVGGGGGGGVGAVGVGAAGGAGDMFSSFRSRKSTQHSQDLRQSKILRRNGLSAPGGFACYKCGKEGHKAANCSGR